NFKKELEKNLNDGLSYPKALADALDNDAINTPNNVLAIEYIKHIKNMKPVAIKRKGSLHDGLGSASDIRNKISNSENISQLMPDSAKEIIENTITANRNAYENLLLYNLRTTTAEELKNTPYVSEGLENRILQAVHKYTNIEDICSSIKTKRYTMARIRRIMTNSLLEITKDDITKEPEYVRVLGMNKKGMEILSNLRDKTNIPVITKVADAPKSKMLDIDINATNIYSILTDKPSMLDLTTSPVIV
ncbi:MAG: nucleotidyltransferase family protein, partial [Clostridia bacterium]|nr:nucleotidyltransferase family protein [Clostridia bacterium]